MHKKFNNVNLNDTQLNEELSIEFLTKIKEIDTSLFSHDDLLKSFKEGRMTNVKIFELVTKDVFHNFELTIRKWTLVGKKNKILKIYLSKTIVSKTIVSKTIYQKQFIKN